MGLFFQIFSLLVLDLSYETQKVIVLWMLVSRKVLLRILKLLQQCIHLGITHLIIESDFQFVVDTLLAEDFDSDLDNLLANIREWMQKFIGCHIKLDYRECNKVAHALARHVWNTKHINMWYVTMEPDFIDPFAWADKLGL